MSTSDDRPFLAELRVSYELDELVEGAIPLDPHVLFERWLRTALETPGIVEPNAMALATSEGLRPSCRIVLLRGHDEHGLTFFTNYESRKGRELFANPQAAAVLWWGALQRQVRVEGPIERLTPEDSDAYFLTRPRGHRLSAWASDQSRPVDDRSTLDASMEARTLAFEGKEVDRPPYWGGFRLVPQTFEFWQGRRNRMHDRIAFHMDGHGWRTERLQP